jgi:hypothetical protein
MVTVGEVMAARVFFFFNNDLAAISNCGQDVFFYKIALIHRRWWPEYISDFSFLKNEV